MIKLEKAKREKIKKMKLLVIPVTILALALIVLAPAHNLVFATPLTPEINVCMHIDSFNYLTVADLKALNVSWVRIDWIPGEMANFMQAMHDSNINVLAIIDANTFNNQNITMDQWNSTVESIMQNSDANYVGAWEIWNEPNNPTWPQAYFTPDVYHDMLSSAYTIIKNYSCASVVAAGLAPLGNWTGYLQTLYAYNDTANYVDYQGVHVYDTIANNLASLSTVDQITGKPIWITEIGEPSAPDPYTSQGQATYIHDNFVALYPYVDKIFWYELYDESGQSPPKENSFGLIMLNETRKPSFDILQSMTISTDTSSVSSNWYDNPYEVAGIAIGLFLVIMFFLWFFERK